MATKETLTADKKDPGTGNGNLAPPTLSLPKGGGAVKGIGEKYVANPFTGTGSLTVPVFTTPARSNFHPQLSLSYDSGAGYGPWGVGWNLSVPSISRKTDKGLPRYQDEVDSDTFILSGAEDLVPSLIPQGASWIRETLETPDREYQIQRYRPRVEGLYARIERLKDTNSGEVHWRTVSRDNVTSIYGLTAGARIADPDDPSRVFRWLLEATFDDRGNAILYVYKPEDRENVDRSAASEKTRLHGARNFSNQYLKHIYYGNQTPFTPDKAAPLPSPGGDWLFQVVFDYGDHDPKHPTVDASVAWPSRQDPFSSFRSGFDIRTYRLCRRILLFHRFPELGPTPCLVRSTDLTHAEGPLATYLSSITQAGYLRQDGSLAYQREAYPPLEFTYTTPQVDDTVHDIDPQSLENLPAGLDGVRYRWLDLDSEGVAGILTEQANAWFYKRNRGSGRFGPVELVASRPTLADLGGGRQQLMDLTGDGEKELVQFSQVPQGYVERGGDGSWGPFIPFRSTPHLLWDDPNLRFVDVDGDGLADILITEDEVFRWHPSLGREGFGPPAWVRKPQNEEAGPALVFADATESIYLADMTGDGLSDIVRIRNGEVCYWPNRGYGRFGAKITMDHAPQFDYPDLFDPKRLRLADIDGSGTTDLIYLGPGAVRFWFNQAGNGWGETQHLQSFPAVDNVAAITVVDLLGRGTACLVWSSPLPGAARQPMRYIDLMGGVKPHLLASLTNNLGLVTQITYEPSTTFYLADREAGTPWVTKLPFPVHVVKRVENFDTITRTKFVNLYAYHHGYYDAPEREFRGFGLVEQWDTEEFAAFVGTGEFPSNADALLHMPPVHTKTWFHTGAYLAERGISKQYATEYYAGDPQAGTLADTVLPSGWTGREEREAVRALRGRVLREEIYAEDKSPQSPHPYRVTEQNYELQRLQPVQDSRFGVFCVHPRETVTYQYERRPQDPRISHDMVLEVDNYGNVTKSVKVGYPRRPAPALPQPYDAEQTRPPLITYTENDFFNKTDDPVWYRVGVPIESRTYEVTGLTDPTTPFSWDDLAAASLWAASVISYEVAPTSAILQRRLIDRTFTLYWTDDLSGWLPKGQVGLHGLTYQSYRMAFTPGLVSQVYQGRVDSTLLQNEGGYRNGRSFQQDGLLDVEGKPDENWWIPSSRQVPDPSQFYLPREFRDPLEHATQLVYDVYQLLLAKTMDPVGNTVQATYDYRTLQPSLITDPNNNLSAAGYDSLGRLSYIALMGKGEGDTRDNPTKRLEYAFAQGGQPSFVHTFEREQHGGMPVWLETYTYSDGSGREILTKTQAASGLARPVDPATGTLLRDTQGQPLPAVPVLDRWVGSGRIVLDNKGNPVKKYEPYFSSTARYEDEKDLVDSVTPVFHYDPSGRLIRTDQPNGTFSQVEFDAWEQKVWDENDTVRLSKWYADRGSPDPSGLEPKSDPESRAAWLAAQHADTFTTARFDSLGRLYLNLADNGPSGIYPTRSGLDIEGNLLSVTDALGDVLGRNLKYNTLEQAFDMVNRKIQARSKDAGESWLLPDVANMPVRAWDDRGFSVRRTYDELRRPSHVYITPLGGAEILAERSVYGEALDLTDSQKANLLGRLHQQYDGAGLATHLQYDFKGNLTATARRLALNYQGTSDWSALEQGLLTLMDHTHGVTDFQTVANPWLEAEPPFLSQTDYDALNRPIRLTKPDESITVYTYNKTRLLDRVDVTLPGRSLQTFVSHIDYNAREQREAIVYGNGVQTTNNYDHQTFRLTRRTTTRGPDKLQDFAYTYDPVGNIVQIDDNAQQTVFFKNAMVPPTARYVYDPIYRLTQATGREHIGQNPVQPTETDLDSVVGLPDPNDASALATYTEAYDYDEVGNILTVMHKVLIPGNPGWTRRYQYGYQVAEPGNRLKATSAPGDAPAALSLIYDHDSNGNISRMPHLPTIDWDFKNQLIRTDRYGAGPVYFTYDSSGQRVRKVVTSQLSSRVEERIYLDGYELHRKFDNNQNKVLERQTVHVLIGDWRIALVETNTTDAGVSVPSPQPLIRYQITDHLGSSITELDESAQVISHEEYHPFGTSAYRATQSGIEAGAKRYRYNGKERDQEIGLYYYGARHYVPWLGRWISCDPAQASVDSNPYVYGNNSPVRFTDPTGKAPVDSSESAAIDVKKNIVREFQSLDMVGQIEFVKNPAKLQALREATGQFRAVAPYVAETHNQVTERTKGTLTVLAAGAVLPVSALLLPYAVGALASAGTVAGDAYLSVGIRIGANYPRLTAAATGLVKLLAGAAGVDTSGAVVGETVAAKTEGQALLSLRDKALALARQEVADDLAQGIKTGPARFGNIIDRIFKGLVENAVSEGQLASTVRTTPKGKFGVDVVNTATGIAYDLTTAVEREVIGHDRRYIGKSVFGVVIRDVLPLLYKR